MSEEEIDQLISKFRAEVMKVTEGMDLESLTLFYNLLNEKISKLKAYENE